MSPRGGKRQGAGRPSGSGKFGETTKAIRVPESMIEDIKTFVLSKGYKLPVYGNKVAAGFPSPADDYIEGRLDLNEHLIQHPASTFFVRVSGLSMIDAGIYPDDILIVDKSIDPVHGKVVIAAIDGELTVKRLYKKDGVIRLMPENQDFAPIELKRESDLIIWGVVTNVIHSV